MSNCEEKSIGGYISCLHRIGASYLSKSYEEYGIGIGQYQFLLQLYLEDGLSHDVLTHRIQMDKATTTRAISKLESGGYVILTPDPQDKRKYKIYLTQKAKLIREEVLKTSYQWEQNLISALSDEEKSVLNNMLKRMYLNNTECSEVQK